MRRTHEPKWMYNKGGDLIGIAMGSDFCAEHEWGTGKMKSEFKCDDSLDGIARRTITHLPPHLRFIDEKEYQAIFLSRTESYYKQPAVWVKEELRRFDKTIPLTCAWDESTFAVVAWGEKDKKNVRKLWDAFQRKDVAFWPNIGVFHLGGGLIFAIPSMVPAEDKQTMLDSDLDNKKLIEASKKTGIEEKVTEAGRRFFALSPKWAKYFKDPDYASKTKHEVIYWLNPMDQHVNNHGWFTVEELEQWIEGKGPIPKSREQLAKEQADRAAEDKRRYRRY